MSTCRNVALLIAVAALGLDCIGADDGAGSDVAATVAALVHDLGGPISSAPAVTRWGQRLDVWARGSDNNVWHNVCLSNCAITTNWLGWEIGAGAPSGGWSGDPTAVAWGTGRVDIFVRSGTKLYHQTWTNSNWLGWEDLGPSIDGSPAVVSWGVGRLDVYARGTDGQLWHRACSTGNCRGSNWQAWESAAGKPMAGVSTLRPAAVSWGTNRIDLFVRGGTDTAVWHNAWTTAGYAGWEPLGGAISSGLGAASWGVNRLDVFGRGNDGQLWQLTYDERPAWRAWRVLAAPLVGAPAAISLSSASVDIFYRGVSNSLRHISCNGDDNCEVPATTTAQAGPNKLAESFRLDIVSRAATGNDVRLTRCNGAGCGSATQSPINLGPSLDSGLAITHWGARVDVFARGTDGRIWHNTCPYRCGQLASWLGWEAGPGMPTNGASSEPTAVAWSSGRIDIFVRSVNELWHQTWTNSGWLGWENLGSDIVSAPGVTSAFRGKLAVYAKGSNGNLWRRVCTTGNCRGNTWGPWQQAALAPMGGLSSSRPAPVAWNSNQTDVFVRGSDNRLYGASDFGAGLGAWSDCGVPTGSTIASGLAATYSITGQVDVIALAANGRLHRWNSKTGLWNDLGVTAQDTPGVIAYDANQGENSAAVVPPGNASCPSGRAFVALGTSRTILQADLNCVGDPNCVEYAAPPDPGDTVDPVLFNSADNVIRATPDGRLLYVKQTFINDGGTVNPSQPIRVVEQLWSSTDCGKTWAVQGRIDPAAFGFAVLPQYCSSNAPPGFDRVETYIDPYDGWVYATAFLSTGNAAGTGCTTANTLFRSSNFGLNWQLANSQFGGGTPFKITSTPGGLFWFSCDGAPLLVWSRNRGTSYYWDTFDGETCLTLQTAAWGGPNGNGSEGISRVGTFPPNTDTVRVNFPVAGKKAGTQAVRLATVRINRSLEVGAPAGSNLVANWTTEKTVGNPATGVGDTANMDTAIVQFATIEPNDGSSTALQYWREVTQATTADPLIQVNYRAVRGADGYSIVVPATPTAYRSSTDFGTWGDYVLGAAYGGNPGNYFLQWSQGEFGISVVKTRVVAVPQGEAQ